MPLQKNYCWRKNKVHVFRTSCGTFLEEKYKIVIFGQKNLPENVFIQKKKKKKKKKKKTFTFYLYVAVDLKNNLYFKFLKTVDF